MINNKLRVLVAIVCAMASKLTAQQEQMYTHYDFNSMAMNPAYAGSKRTLVASALSRVQWANYPGAPKYQSLSIHTPISQAPAFRDIERSNGKNRKIRGCIAIWRNRSCWKYCVSQTNHA